MCLAEPMISADFFCSAVYFEVSASFIAATLFGLDWRKMLAASAVPSYCSSCLAPSVFLGDLLIMKPSIGASIESVPLAELNSG